MLKRLHADELQISNCLDVCWWVYIQMKKLFGCMLVRLHTDKKTVLMYVEGGAYRLNLDIKLF